MEEKRARFEKLAMPVVNALYRQAMKFTNNPEDAQDLVQDTFERGFKAFDTFKPGSNFEAWMTTIERNAFFNQYAKAKRRPKRANDSTGEYDDWDIYAASEHASQGLRSAEQEYLEAFAPEEIMAALSRLNRARNQLKQELAEYAAARGYGKTARGNKTTGKSVESHSDRELVGASGKAAQ